MYTVAIITCSDKGYAGKRVDESGEAIKEIIKSHNLNLIEYKILPDDKEMIKDTLIKYCDEGSINLILTTGGTGFSKRDVTPEATKEVIEREAPGVCEAIRNYSMRITKRAMLSRAVCGIRGNSVILNLPGSKKAVIESLEFAIESLVHGVDILVGNDSECGR